MLAISARSDENPSGASVEEGGVGRVGGVGEPGGGEGGDLTEVVDIAEEMTGWIVVGRLGAAWGASSRLSVESPKLRLEVAAEMEGLSRRDADEGRTKVELWVAATVGEMTEEMTWDLGAARGATTGE